MTNERKQITFDPLLIKGERRVVISSVKITITNILIIVLSAVIAFSGFRLWNIFHEYHEGDKQYSDTASRYSHTKDPDNTLSDDDPQVCPITVDFEGLKAINPEVVGWIYSPDTQINYPVVLGEDNEKYLHQMINGQYNSAPYEERLHVRLPAPVHQAGILR